MNAIGSIGIIGIILVCVVVAVLGFLLPVFIYLINKRVKHLHKINVELLRQLVNIASNMPNNEYMAELIQGTNYRLDKITGGE